MRFFVSVRFCPYNLVPRVNWRERALGTRLTPIAIAVCNSHLADQYFIMRKFHDLMVHIDLTPPGRLVLKVLSEFDRNLSPIR